MSESPQSRLEPPVHPGVNILERIPPELIEDFLANNTVDATPDFRLDHWQNAEIFAHCTAGISVARRTFSHPAEVRLAMQSPTQQRKYLVSPNEAGVIVDGAPYSPMGIAVKGVFLTYEMMLSRTLMSAKRLARTSPQTLTRRLKDSPFAEGVAMSLRGRLRIRTK